MPVSRAEILSLAVTSLTSPPPAPTPTHPPTHPNPDQQTSEITAEASLARPASTLHCFLSPCTARQFPHHQITFKFMASGSQGASRFCTDNGRHHNVDPASTGPGEWERVGVGGGGGELGPTGTALCAELIVPPQQADRGGVALALRLHDAGLERSPLRLQLRAPRSRVLRLRLKPPHPRRRRAHLLLRLRRRPNRQLPPACRLNAE